LENSRPKPGRMEETLEGGRGPPRAVQPLERERDATDEHLLHLVGILFPHINDDSRSKPQ